MQDMGYWFSLAKEIQSNPIAINKWGPEIKKIAAYYNSAKKSYTCPVSDTVKEFLDQLVFKADPRLYEGPIDELFTILECVSPIFKLEVDDAYSTLLLLVSPNMKEALDHITTEAKFGTEFNLVMDIFNFFIPTDYIEYTIFHVFGGKPFLGGVLSRPYDSNYVTELLGTVKPDIAENSIVQSNLTKMLHYIWDIYTKREMRLTCLKQFYNQHFESYYEKDIKRLIEKYAKKFGNKKEELYDAIKEINFIIVQNPEDYAVKIARFLVYDCRELLGEGNQPRESFLIDAISILQTNGIADLPTDAASMAKTITNSTDIFYSEMLRRAEPVVESDTAVSLSNLDIALEASKKMRTTVARKYQEAETKVSRGYNAFKRNEVAVDNQLNKIVGIAKRGFLGDTRTEIIEGKEFSLITLLKRVLSTAAVFHFSKIGGLLYVITSKILRKKNNKSERQKLMMELEEEIEIINEKLEDARADGNRKAKYQLMRTKKELENARDRIRYGITADEKSNKTASNILTRNTIVNRSGKE